MYTVSLFSVLSRFYDEETHDILAISQQLDQCRPNIITLALNETKHWSDIFCCRKITQETKETVHLQKIITKAKAELYLKGFDLYSFVRKAYLNSNNSFLDESDLRELFIHDPKEAERFLQIYNSMHNDIMLVGAEPVDWAPSEKTICNRIQDHRVNFLHCTKI